MYFLTHTQRQGMSETDVQPCICGRLSHSSWLSSDLMQYLLMQTGKQYAFSVFGQLSASYFACKSRIWSIHCLARVVVRARTKRVGSG